MTAENGEKISLAGMSLFWSTAEDVTNFYNAETIDFLADEWEIDIIRTAMGVKESWDGGRGYVDSPDTQKEMIKNVIDAAIANDIYVIVDWHTHYAENYIDEAVTFFSEISEEYGHNDHIIYEIYNEPIWQSWTTIKSYAETVIDAIREKDPDNLIIVGSREWSQRVDEAAADPIEDDNVAYTIHFYAGTHGQFLRDRASQAMEDGIPIFVTEWGTVSADGNGGVNTSETNAWIEFMKDNHISHANWSVGDKNESSAIINVNKGIHGLKNDDLTTSGILVKSIIQDQEVTLSVADIEKYQSNMTFYPNPTNGLVTISENLKDYEYRIVNALGQRMTNSASNTSTIDLSDYAKGIYILALIKDGKTVKKELLIKK